MADQHADGRCNASFTVPARDPQPPAAPSTPAPSIELITAVPLSSLPPPPPCDAPAAPPAARAGPSGSAAMGEAAAVRRALAARELAETERTYVEALDALVATFAKPAREKGVLTQEQCSALFANAESLAALHKEVLQRLTAALETGEVADVFLELGPMLRMYKVYSSNYSQALATLESLCKMDKWTSFCRDSLSLEASEQATESFVLLKLTSLLITPVQRIPRYILLLQDILSHTSADDPQHAKLSKALNLLSEIAAEVNTHMSRSELYTRALQIQHSLVGSDVPHLLEAHRVFVREGDLHKITSRFVTSCHLFLFNDILVYSHQKLGPWAWRYKGSVSLGPCWTRELKDTAKLKNLFQIVTPKKTWTFYTATPAEKDAWLSDLNRLIDTLVRKDPTLLDERKDIKVTERGGLWRIMSSKLETVDPEYHALRLEREEAAEDNSRRASIKARYSKGKMGEIATPLLFVAGPNDEEYGTPDRSRSGGLCSCCKSCCCIL
eukprot:m51a1_g2978 putative domain containing protein (498) ;mRNA; r:715402-717045